jgi:hypothetical protein
LCRMSKDGEGEHVGLFALLEESVESNIETAVLTEYNGIHSLSAYREQSTHFLPGPVKEAQIYIRKICNTSSPLLSLSQSIHTCMHDMYCTYTMWRISSVY